MGQPVEPRPRATRRNLVWLVTHVVIGLPAGAFALLCLGSLFEHTSRSVSTVRPALSRPVRRPRGPDGAAPLTRRVRSAQVGAGDQLATSDRVVCFDHLRAMTKGRGFKADRARPGMVERLAALPSRAVGRLLRGGAGRAIPAVARRFDWAPRALPG